MPSIALRALAGLAGLLLPASLAAQTDSLLRPVTSTPLGVELAGPARPGAYVSAAGPRAIAMGTETGGFEVWTWPIKLLHRFELRFQTPLFNEPVRGEAVARSVEITPAGPVVTYTHPAFTVRQRVFVPVNEPAVVMLLDVTAVRPVEILGEFISDLQLAWPGAVGGQYVFWDDTEKAFILSESQRKLNGMVGSPFTTSATNQPAHDVPDAPSQLRIAVGDPARAPMPRPGEPVGRLTRLEVRGIPIVFVGAAAPRDSVKAIYHRVLARIPALYAEREAAARAVLAQSLELESPEPRLDQALRWAELNLADALVCNPDLGCGLVAGYGPSESRGARPGFGWFFGGDAAVNSLGLDATGQFDHARQGLEFFARYQRADGKIPHEISQSAGKIRWFEDFPYAFYHADTTPYWLLALGDYWKASGDTETIRRLWPAIRKAYDWCVSTTDPATGLMLNSKGGLGAVEVGDLGVGVVSDIYLSAVWVEALDRMARMAEVIGRSGGRTDGRTARPAKPREDPFVTGVRKLRETALASLRERFWLPEQRMYAFALLEGGTLRPERTAWPSTALAFGLFDEERGAAGAAAQAGSALVTDWGSRSLAGTSALFDPLHYNNGTVWPFVTGFAALGQYRYHNPVSGFQSLMQLVQSGSVWGLGRNPEVFAGMQNEPLETAVPQQFFGTSFIPTVVSRGLLGWEPDAPAAAVRLAPQLPAEWDSLTVRNLPVGDRRYEVRVQRSPTMLRVQVHRTAGTIADTVYFTAHLPPGALPDSQKTQGVALLAAEARRTMHGAEVPMTAVMSQDATFTVYFSPGYEVMLPPVNSRRGDRSHGLRLVEQRLEGNALRLTLDGPAGSTATIRVRHGAVKEIPVHFPEAGDAVDGYARTELTVE